MSEEAVVTAWLNDIALYRIQGASYAQLQRWGRDQCGWPVPAAQTWDPRLEGRIASYTSASGPSLDHLGSIASTWSGRLRLLPQVLHSWYVWLFQVPWLPERVWAHLQWLFRPLIGRLDPTTKALPWGREVRQNTRHSIDLYRANIIPRLREPLPWRTSIPVQVLSKPSALQSGG